MYLPLCGSGVILCIPGFQTRLPYPPSGAGRTTGTGVSAAMWEWMDPVHSWFFHAASLSPKWPKQDRRDSGVSAAVWGWLVRVRTGVSHEVSLSPTGHGQDRRD